MRQIRHSLAIISIAEIEDMGELYAKREREGKQNEKWGGFLFSGLLGGSRLRTTHIGVAHAALDSDQVRSQSFMQAQG